MFTCKHCGEGFPETTDVRRHLYYEHITQGERDSLQKPLYGSVKIDYLELKATFWSCQICMKYGKKVGKRTGAMKSRMARKRSTITSHLNLCHNKMTIEEYELAISSPKEEEIPVKKACIWANQFGRKYAEESPTPKREMQDSSFMKPFKEEPRDIPEATIQNEVIDKKPWIMSEEESEDGKPWWDGCSYKCKHCGYEFPDTSEVRAHIWNEHASAIERKNSKTPNACGSINKDYEVHKVTYWHCRLCALDGSKMQPFKGKIYRKHSSITAHLKGQHNLPSIEDYLQKIQGTGTIKEEVGTTTKSKRSLRQMNKNHQDFHEIATGKRMCLICRKDNLRSLESHILDCHNITSLDEYDEVVLYLPKPSIDEQKLQEPVASTGDANGLPPDPCLRKPKVGHCHICDKELCNESYLRHHMKNVHGIDATITHINTASESLGVGIDIASFGSTITITKIEDEDGLRQSGPTIPYEGPQPSNVIIEEPKKQNTARKNYCHICKKKLCNERYFQTHMKKMHGDEDGKSSATCTIGTLKCKVCKKGQIKSLQTHTCNMRSLEEYEALVKVQFEPRLNFCQICEKKLCNDSYLKVHLDKMHGLRSKAGYSESNINSHSKDITSPSEESTITITKIREENADMEVGQEIPGLNSDFPGLNVGNYIDPLENINAIVKEEIMLPELFLPDNLGNLLM